MSKISVTRQSHYHILGIFTRRLETKVNVRILLYTCLFILCHNALMFNGILTAKICKNPIVISLLSLIAVVVFAFVLCWLPFHVGRYLISKSTEMGSPLLSVISQYCNLISFVLFYLSAAINPILYNIMSKKYRMAACKLFGLHNNPRRTASMVKGEGSPCWTESTVSL